MSLMDGGHTSRGKQLKWKSLEYLSRQNSSNSGTFLVTLWLGLQAGGASSISGQWTKIQQATWQKKKIKSLEP